MLNDPVLVLGSKPNSIIPDLNFNKIYAANGAAERGYFVKKKNYNTKLNCIVPMREFLKNENVKKRVLDSKPDRVVFRTFERDIKELFSEKCKIENLSWKEQFQIQCDYVKFSPYSIYLGEIQRNENISDKFKYFLKCALKKQFLGISTGFFSIILAHKENPFSDIVVSGIGMTGGKHFYKSERSKKYNYTSRSRVDRFVSKFIVNSIKSKIYSVDDDFVKYTNTKKLETQSTI